MKQVRAFAGALSGEALCLPGYDLYRSAGFELGEGWVEGTERYRSLRPEHILQAPFQFIAVQVLVLQQTKDGHLEHTGMIPVRCIEPLYSPTAGNCGAAGTVVSCDGAMAMRPVARKVPSSGVPLQLLGTVDYRLARNLVVSQYKRGELTRVEVCDAHPELLRAAVGAGQGSGEECPICQHMELRHVSYVFGHRLPAGGRCVASSGDLTKLASKGGDLYCYVVEVCPSCAWNHVARAFSVKSA